jgi:hypothetical protein
LKISPIIRSPNHRYLTETGEHDLGFPPKKWEITMRKTILTVVSASIIAAFTAQSAAAGSAHHRARTNGRVVATEQFRNSNAYVAPIVIQPGSGPYSSWSGYDGAMGSGIAGH